MPVIRGVCFCITNMQLINGLKKKKIIIIVIIGPNMQVLRSQQDNGDCNKDFLLRVLLKK